MAILDTAQLFAKSMVPTVGGRSGARRVPFTFTSTRRLLKFGPNAGMTSRELAKINAEVQRSATLTTIENAERSSATFGTLGLSPASSAIGAVTNSPIIQMAVNPSSVTWSQNKRYSKQDTQNGSVFFHFSDENGRNNDILTLSFSGSTGNIGTQQGFIEAVQIGADQKLRTWHELYGLSREPVLLSDDINRTSVITGVKNEFFITYRTVLMPMPITLVGFFNQVLNFTESADTPFTRNYSFEFTVVHTYPDLDKLVDSLNSALTSVSPISAAAQVL